MCMWQSKRMRTTYQGQRRRIHFQTMESKQEKCALWHSHRANVRAMVDCYMGLDLLLPSDLHKQTLLRNWRSGHYRNVLCWRIYLWEFHARCFLCGRVLRNILGWIFPRNPTYVARLFLLFRVLIVLLRLDSNGFYNAIVRLRLRWWGMYRARHGFRIDYLHWYHSLHLCCYVHLLEIHKWSNYRYACCGLLVGNVQ